MGLDTYAEVKKQSGDSLILVSMGTTVIDAAKLPDEITTIEGGIRLLMDIHNLNLKDVPDGDGYSNLKVEDKKITFEDHTTFPHDVIYGYIYGMAQRFRPEKTRPIVEREYLNKDEPDYGGAKYTITW
ncbi:MAG: hypothetical protein AAFR67_10260 [Chloroflexota bacterium]